MAPHPEWLIGLDWPVVGCEMRYRKHTICVAILFLRCLPPLQPTCALRIRHANTVRSYTILDPRFRAGSVAGAFLRSASSMLL